MFRLVALPFLNASFVVNYTEIGGILRHRSNCGQDDNST